MSITQETPAGLPAELVSDPGYEYALSCYSASLDVHAEENEASTTVRVRMSHRDSIDPFAAVSALQSIDRNRWGSESPDTELMNMIRPDGHLSAFARNPGFRAVHERLGYRALDTITQADGRIVRDVAFTYPSLPHLNAAAAEIFPSTPLKLVPFAGGQYHHETFIRSLADRGEVLVATEQPYELHDHGVRHLLGWLGMGEDFVDPMRERLAELLEAYDQNPGPTDGPNKQLAMAMSGLDVGSFMVAHELANLHGGREQLAHHLKYALSSYLMSELYMDPKYLHTNYEYMTLQKSSFFADSAQTIVDRYNAAEAVATK